MSSFEDTSRCCDLCIPSLQRPACGQCVDCDAHLCWKCCQTHAEAWITEHHELRQAVEYQCSEGCGELLAMREGAVLTCGVCESKVPSETALQCRAECTLSTVCRDCQEGATLSDRRAVLASRLAMDLRLVAHDEPTPTAPDPLPLTSATAAASLVAMEALASAAELPPAWLARVTRVLVAQVAAGKSAQELATVAVATVTAADATLGAALRQRLRRVVAARVTCSTAALVNVGVQVVAPTRCIGTQGEAATEHTQERMEPAPPSALGWDAVAQDCHSAAGQRGGCSPGSTSHVWRQLSRLDSEVAAAEAQSQRGTPRAPAPSGRPARPRGPLNRHPGPAPKGWKPGERRPTSRQASREQPGRELSIEGGRSQSGKGTNLPAMVDAQSEDHVSAQNGRRGCVAKLDSDRTKPKVLIHTAKQTEKRRSLNGVVAATSDEGDVPPSVVLPLAIVGGHRQEQGRCFSVGSFAASFGGR